MTASEPLSESLLEVRGLVVEYPLPEAKGERGQAAVRRAVDGLSFDVRAGECFALVGESGCGKTSAAKAILRLVPSSDGRVMLRPSQGAPLVDWMALGTRALRPLRSRVQIVFQDPRASLNPRMEVGEAVAEVLRVHAALSSRVAREEAAELFERVGLSAELRWRYPHQLSGGQRQRVAIARALAAKPRLLVCDEIVSALDVSIQAQVLNLLAELRESLGLAYLFIAHDLAVVRQIADRVAVMHAGRIVEEGRPEAVLHHPQHEITRSLIASLPNLPPR